MGEEKEKNNLTCGPRGTQDPKYSWNPRRIVKK